MNLAGRLHAVAQPNTVVIAPGTHALLGGRFLYADLGTHSLKGFGEPVACWRVVRPRPVASRFKAGGDAVRAPLFGREDEVALLLDLWRSAAARRGRVAMLVGEAGIGKSRVAEALFERLDEACVPLRFQCSPHYIEPGAASGDPRTSSWPPRSASKTRRRRSSRSSRRGWTRRPTDSGNWRCWQRFCRFRRRLPRRFRP